MGKLLGKSNTDLFKVSNIKNKLFIKNLFASKLFIFFYPKHCLQKNKHQCFTTESKIKYDYIKKNNFSFRFIFYKKNLSWHLVRHRGKIFIYKNCICFLYRVFFVCFFFIIFLTILTNRNRGRGLLLRLDCVAITGQGSLANSRNPFDDRSPL